MKQANYLSPEFFNILETVNKTLTENNVEPITAEQGVVRKSKYNVGMYNNKYIWRITHAAAPQLFNKDIMFKIYSKLKATYHEYIENKTITTGNPAYTKDVAGEPIASITIMVTELPDNVISKDDLFAVYHSDEEAIKKCLEIESRMFKRDGDTREPIVRIDDFAASLVYEPKLCAAELKNISDLSVKHQTDVITLETDDQTDFSGKVNGVDVQIEGKSTRSDVEYEDTEVGHQEFAKYFERRLNEGSLGSIHHADYVLFVIKPTGKVVCVSVNNPEENWLAGNIND